MENKIYAHIITPLQKTSLTKDITAKAIYTALNIKESAHISDLYLRGFCKKPLLFERAENLPNRRAVSAFKTVKKAEFISLDLLRRIKSEMGNLTPTEALVTMLLFGRAKAEKGYLYSYCETFDFDLSEELDFTLTEPFVKVIPKGCETWFFAQKLYLKKGDIIEIAGYKFSVIDIIALENRGEMLLTQSDFTLCENPVLHRESRSLFRIKWDENSNRKRIMRGAVLDPRDTLTESDCPLKPFTLKL